MGLVAIKKHMSDIKTKKLHKAGTAIGKGTLLFASRDSFGSEPYLIHIGEQCVIANGVRFITHDGAIRVINNKEEYKYINNKYGKIDIRDRVYLGENSIIMPNVTIGPNACVLPGSVVYNNIPPNTMAGGNPARIKNKIEDFESYYQAEIYDYYQKCFNKFYKHLLK
jgi:acetyltransferase-like isoleucine patch superfamily enzyme